MFSTLAGHLYFIKLAAFPVFLKICEILIKCDSNATVTVLSRNKYRHFGPLASHIIFNVKY